MPKVVKDIELTNLPDVIDNLQSYDGAFCLLRYYGKPVGKIILPAKDGKIVLKDHLEKIKAAVKKDWKKAVLQHFLSPGEEGESQHKTVPVSIAVCTRNRTDDLKDCLDALMRLPHRGQEIIVIDNAPSTNDTKNLVAQYPSVRYILEERKGLDIARNRAIAEASNDIVAFTDDDALVDANWLDALARHFEDPIVMCVTGMTMPLELETEAQEAFENYNPFGKGFSKKKFSISKDDPLNVGSIGAGANMALRKTCMAETGWFDEALDAGTITQSGGDHEFFARILLAGYYIIYDPEALSWHRHRRTWKEATKAMHGYGVGVYAFWTRLLFKEKQYSILRLPGIWLLNHQLPNLYKWFLKRNKDYPLSFILAELKGCLKGPFTYFKSRKQLNKSFKNQNG
jgi:GT2 family glycosyltransferase